MTNIRDEYKEDRQYEDTGVKRIIAEKEAQLEAIDKNEDMQRKDQIVKLNIVKELIRYYTNLRYLDRTDSKDNRTEEEYQEWIEDSIEQYRIIEEDLEKILQDYEHQKHINSSESKSWNEYRDEERD